MESKNNNEIILQESTTPTSQISFNDVISDGVDDDEKDCNPSATNSASPDNGKIDGMEERGATRSTSQPFQKRSSTFRDKEEFALVKGLSETLSQKNKKKQQQIKEVIL